MERLMCGSFAIVVVLCGLGPVPADATISFTCAGNIDAIVGGTCNFLNTTVAGFYTSHFNDGSANIYIQYGTPPGSAVAASSSAIDGFTYA